MKRIIIFFLVNFLFINIFSQELKISELLTFKTSSDLEIGLFLQKSGFKMTCEYIILGPNHQTKTPVMMCKDKKFYLYYDQDGKLNIYVWDNEILIDNLLFQLKKYRSELSEYRDCVSYYPPKAIYPIFVMHVKEKNHLYISLLENKSIEKFQEYSDNY